MDDGPVTYPKFGAGIRRADSAQTAAVEAASAGSLDAAGRNGLAGWAPRDADGRPSLIQVLDGAHLLAVVGAESARPDLAGSGLGDCGFSFTPAAPMPAGKRLVLRAIRADDGRELHGSPRVIEAGAPDRWTGNVDAVDRDGIEGWADEGLGPVALEVVVDGHVVMRTIANRHRADLVAAGVGDGRRAFSYAFSPPLDAGRTHSVGVRRESDGMHVPGSPVAIAEAVAFGPPLRRTIAGAVEGMAVDGRGGEHDQVAAFLASQLSRMLERRAEADGDRNARIAAADFRRRWGPLADGLPMRPREPGRRALMVDGCWPDSGRDAGSVALLSHAASLARLGYRVTMAGADGMDDPPDLSSAGIEACGEPHYASVEELLRRRAGCFDVVYLHRAESAHRYMAIARHHNPRARILYSVADLHYVRMARQAAVQGRQDIADASRRMRLVECTAAWSADAVITHSSVEAGMLRTSVPEAAVHRVPWEVPVYGVPAPPLRSRSGIAFIGGFGHAPNQDAAAWLASEVMPAVRAIDPSIACMVVGHGTGDWKERMPGLRMAGPVDDLHAGVLHRVRLTVAPLRWGAGVKGKVLASMAAGIPCAMTPVAAEGLDLPDKLGPTIAGDAAGLAAVIVALHHAGGAANRAAAQLGLTLVSKGHSAAAVDGALAAAIDGRAIAPDAAGEGVRRPVPREPLPGRSRANLAVQPRRRHAPP